MILRAQSKKVNHLQRYLKDLCGVKEQAYKPYLSYQYHCCTKNQTYYSGKKLKAQSFFGCATTFSIIQLQNRQRRLYRLQYWAASVKFL